MELRQREIMKQLRKTEAFTTFGGSEGKVAARVAAD